ncbi:hypothetical protein ABEV74_14315 [Paenibacillus cisolokensis]|jgi:hypothetical protein|uniref:hypothetical protein n=1 Tax=Paenibacillus TaxID=44249 RepID=UPI00071ED436|nr:hypothetical protein [Paenibacillus sp. 32O-W]ALS27854.1 hypothetical protein IJ21_24580 [Paenibacillus sp. 32O-W]
MVLTFVCDCGNRVDFFDTADTDEHGRAILEPEDDDRLKLMQGEDGMVFRCSFCNRSYRVLAVK